MSKVSVKQRYAEAWKYARLIRSITNAENEIAYQMETTDISAREDYEHYREYSGIDAIEAQITRELPHIDKNPYRASAITHLVAREASKYVRWNERQFKKWLYDQRKKEKTGSA